MRASPEGKGTSGVRRTTPSNLFAAAEMSTSSETLTPASDHLCGCFATRTQRTVSVTLAPHSRWQRSGARLAGPELSLETLELGREALELGGTGRSPWVTALARRVAGLTLGVARPKPRVTVLTLGVAALEPGVTALTPGVPTLKTGVAGLKPGVAGLLPGVAALKRSVPALKP